ncbi:dihydroneopterin aldolase [Limibacillus halophilus]
MSLPIPDPAALGCEVAGQRIVARNMIIACHVGYPEEERVSEQELRFDVELTVEPLRPLEDSIHQVVDYGPLFEEMRAICAESSPRLLEVLADQILAVFLSHELVTEARVRIEKKSLYDDAEGIGVEVAWRRKK